MGKCKFRTGSLAAFFSVLLLAGCSADGHLGGDTGKTPDALFAEHRGSWILVNYWAQWCKPCIEEIPELNAVHRDHDNITVFGVNFDGATGDALAEQERQLDIAFPSLAEDPSFALGIRRPPVLPTTLVISPAGTLARTLIGPQTRETLVAATAPEDGEKEGGQKNADAKAGNSKEDLDGIQ